MQKKISLVLIIIGLIIASISSFGVPALSIITTTSSPPPNKPSSTMTGTLTTDKSTYALGENIQWTATGLTVGSPYTIWIKGYSSLQIDDSSINTFIATSSTMSGTTLYNYPSATALVIGNMGRWSQYGTIMYDTSTLASVSISNNPTSTTTTSLGSATIIVTLLDSNNHPVPYYSIIYCTNVVPHLDSYSSNTASDGTAKFKNLDGTATYQVSGKNTNSVTVSFSSSTQTVQVTLHINSPTTTSTTTSTSTLTTTSGTTTTHTTTTTTIATTTTTTTTSISTSITGTQTITTTITKTETQTLPTTTTSTNILTGEILGINYGQIFGGALSLVGVVGFVRSKEQHI